MYKVSLTAAHYYKLISQYFLATTANSQENISELNQSTRLILQ